MLIYFSVQPWTVKHYSLAAAWTATQPAGLQSEVQHRVIVVNLTFPLKFHSLFRLCSKPSRPLPSPVLRSHSAFALFHNILKECLCLDGGRLEKIRCVCRSSANKHFFHFFGFGKLILLTTVLEASTAADPSRCERRGAEPAS